MSMRCSRLTSLSSLLARRRTFIEKCSSFVIGLSLITSVLALRPLKADAVQSPYPNAWMEDAAPGGSYTPGVGTAVVEGEEGDLANNGGCPYGWGSALVSTVNLLNAGARTVTEFTPVSACAPGGSIQQYEALAASFAYLVFQDSSNASSGWGGIMWDEEPGYGFGTSDLEALNTYTAGVMDGYPGPCWLFSEDQPNGWYESTYNAIINAGNSYPAPQVYSDSMAAAVNGSSPTLGENMVTTWTGAPGPYGGVNGAAYALSQINGSAWSGVGLYGYNYWYNIYRNA
jgi:hypothetical protein